MKVIKKINNGSVIYKRKNEKLEKLKYALYSFCMGFIICYMLIIYLSV